MFQVQKNRALFSCACTQNLGRLQLILTIFIREYNSSLTAHTHAHVNLSYLFNLMSFLQGIEY